MKKTLLSILLCAGAFTLHAADSSPLASAKFRWNMASGSDLKPSGAVKTGIALKGVEREASLTRGGDGMVADFAGGWLALADARLRLLKDLPSFTLFLRAKADKLNGTLLVQQGADKEDSGDFEFSAWPVPYLERQNLVFDGRVTGGLPVAARRSHISTNVKGDSGWNDIVLIFKKGTGFEMFINGELRETRTIGTNVAVDDSRVKGKPSALTIGARPDGSDPFLGQIDEIALWDRALSDEELAGLFQKPMTHQMVAKRAKSDRMLGTGVFDDTKTPVTERIAWVDRRLPEFRQQLQNTDPNFPRYHIGVPGDNWNPIAFFHKGTHHLFLANTLGGYQNAFKDYSDPIILQHLVSEDLIHWKIMPLPAMRPDGGQFENGTFFVNDKGEIVFLFYGEHRPGNIPYMAVSRDDELRDWELQPDTVTINGVPADLRRRHDPSAVWKRGDTWFMTATTACPDASTMRLPLYRSKDLVNWDYAGLFYEDADGDPVSECGQMFPLGGRQVFATSHLLDENATYLTGKVNDDGTFTREYAGTPDWHSREQNLVTVTVDDTGAVTMWKKMNDVRGHRASLEAGWRNTYSIPRDVRMAEGGRLVFRPSPAIEKLRGNPVPLETLKAASSEIRLTFPAGERGETGIRLSDGKWFLEAFYDHASREICLDFSGLSKALSVRAGVKPRAPVSVPPGDTVTLRFFADRSVFELYANDEVVISNAGFFSDPENLKAKLFQRGGAAAEVKVEAWEMEPLKWTTYKPDDKAIETTKQTKGTK